MLRLLIASFTAAGVISSGVCFCSDTGLLTSVGDTTYNLYLGNLHSHTGYSDGQETPAVAFEYARDVAGIDFLAVTDHHHMLTAEEYDDILLQAELFTEDGVYVAIAGQEWTGEEMNHCNVFEAGYVLKAPINRIDSLYKEVAATGCTGHFCHPKPENWDEFAYSAVADPYLNAVEVRNEVEEGCYITMLRNGWHVGTDGSQDNHGPNWGNGHWWTVAVACSLTKPHILDAMRKHRTYSTLDRQVSLVYRAENRWMGESFSHAGNIEFSVQVYDPDPADHFYYLELFQNGFPIAWTDIDTHSYTWNPEITPPCGENHYFVKVHQFGADYAWSSPVWIECTTTRPSTPRPAPCEDTYIISGVTPTLCWHPSEQVERYRLQCSPWKWFPGGDSTLSISGISDTCHTFADSLDDDVWYYWRVRAENNSGWSTYSGICEFLTDADSSSAPAGGLPSIWVSDIKTAPNPLADWTAVEFTVTKRMPVEIAIYDVLGKKVKLLSAGTMLYGPQKIFWDGTGSDGLRVPPGVYLCRLSAGGRSAFRKLVVIR
jgi:hypothetical protein